MASFLRRLKLSNTSSIWDTNKWFIRSWVRARARARAKEISLYTRKSPFIQYFLFCWEYVFTLILTTLHLIHTNSFSPPPALDADSQRTRIHEILSSMPHPNLCTFRYLMHHLHQVQANQEVNKMNASNLAIVFWPTLIRPPLMDLADASKQMGWQLIMTRIIEHPDFVPEVLLGD